MADSRNWAGTRLGFGLSRPKVQNFVQTRFRSEPLKPPVAEIETETWISCYFKKKRKTSILWLYEYRVFQNCNNQALFFTCDTLTLGKPYGINCGDVRCLLHYEKKRKKEFYHHILI